MSAICGVLSSSPAGTHRDILAAMLHRIRHRGPDASNSFVDPVAGMAFGHLHLHAFATGSLHSPAFAVTDTAVVAIDGSVTNVDSFAPSLAVLSPSVPAHRAARAVLAAYAAHGRDFLTRLDGPFSVALWDRRQNRLFLSRDKLGERSLYYYNDSPQAPIVFASEIKGILAHPAVRPVLDLDGLSLYLAFGYIPGPRTLFKSIYKLLPGECLEVEPGRPPRRTVYWQLPPIADDLDDEQYCIRRLRELFLTGLHRYLDGSQDVAVFLSGGMDSSIIVAALRELDIPRISTFTLGFTLAAADPRKQDDLHYARLVAQRFGTRHHPIVVAPGHDPGVRLPRVITQFDDLTMTPNTYSKALLVEAVRDAGLNSVLTGSAAAGACGVHRQFLDPAKRQRLLRKTETCDSDEERYLELRSRLFSLRQQHRMLTRPPRLTTNDMLDTLRHYTGRIRSDDFFRSFLFTNLLITCAEKTLNVLDKAGTMYSVEVRSPYLHPALVEFATRLPSSFDGGASYVSMKTHLKEAFRHQLPPAVLERKVIGYPSYYWNNGELRGLQRRLLNRESVAENGLFSYDGLLQVLEEETDPDAKAAGKHQWAVLQFCLWYEIHIKRNPEFLADAPNGG